MESGKLFVVGTTNVIRGELFAKEFPMQMFGFRKKILGIEEALNFIWCENGEIYRLK